ncbi:MAG: hypothetical protein HN420_09980, partial [Rhodospirillaceae bacterium]|nr:hypothetical protein [Rhodospirillaceae bacterium]
MSLFADAGNFLSTAVESLGGVEGTYRRGEEFDLPILVAWGSKLFVSHDGHGASIRSTQRYGLIRSALLNH